MTFILPNLLENLLLISKYTIMFMELCGASATFTCYFYITYCSRRCDNFKNLKKNDTSHVVKLDCSVI